MSRNLTRQILIIHQRYQTKKECSTMSVLSNSAFWTSIATTDLPYYRVRPQTKCKQEPCRVPWHPPKRRLLSIFNTSVSAFQKHFGSVRISQKATCHMVNIPTSVGSSRGDVVLIEAGSSRAMSVLGMVRRLIERRAPSAISWRSMTWGTIGDAR